MENYVTNFKFLIWGGTMKNKGFWEGSDTAHSPLATLPVDALYEVLDYLYEFEKEDWIESDKPRDHIFIQIEKMAKWYNTNRNTIEKARGTKINMKPLSKLL